MASGRRRDRSGPRSPSAFQLPSRHPLPRPKWLGSKVEPSQGKVESIDMNCIHPEQAAARVRCEGPRALERHCPVAARSNLLGPVASTLSIPVVNARADERTAVLQDFAAACDNVQRRQCVRHQCQNDRSCPQGHISSISVRSAWVSQFHTRAKPIARRRNSCGTGSNEPR